MGVARQSPTGALKIKTNMSEDPQSELKPGSSTPELSEAQEEESKAKDETTPNDEDMKDEDEEDEEAKKKKQEELRKKYADWPLKGIKDPHDNDVMYGRGGGTNHHPGNKNYRKMVEDRKLEYVNSKRLDKPLVALEIIRLWRAQVPPGRFLKLDDKTGLWHDVGDKKAREKTSQALREKAPLIRKQQEEDGEEENGDSKTTRFAEGTKKEDAGVNKAVLARDHSLGREYIEAGTAVSLDGFSWQDPFQAKQRESSYGRPAAPTAYPAGRNSSHGSLGMAPPHHTSIGGPPPPPDYWGRVNGHHSQQREFSTGRIESWGNSSFGYAPPPPGPPGHPLHQRSGSWTHGPPPPPGQAVHQRSGSWGSGREHSLGMFPLIGASVSNAADRDTFDSGRSAPGYWADQVASPSRGGPPPPPPPPPAYGAPARSSGSLGPYRQNLSPANSTPSPTPAYNVDVNIAKTWSGGEVQTSWPNEMPQNGMPYDGMPRPVHGADESPMREPSGTIMPRPQMVKRDTSHQNESYETKPQVKRAALNRDNSLASNRLKQEYMPEYFNKKFDADQAMRSLSTNFEQSTLDTDRPKPQPIGDGGRVSTMDAITMDLMVKPAPMLDGDRVSTIDALDLNLDNDDLIKPASESDGTLKDLPKPNTLEPDDRLTTKDFMALVNSPIAEVDPDAPKTESGDPLPLNQEKIADEWLTQV